MRVLEMTKAFYIGGTEGQVVELLRGLSNRCELEVAVLEEAGPLLEQVWKEGLLPHAFPVGTSFLSAKALFQIARMAHWLSERKIDLVHAHDFYTTLLAVPASRLAGVPVVVGRLDLLHWHGPERAKALRLLTKMADHVIVNAEAIRSHLIENEGLPREKMTLIRNGLNLERLEQKRRAGLLAPLPETGNAPIVVHVANMGHEVKRQEDVLAALPLVLERFGKVHVFFVGDGDRRPFLMDLARRRGVEAYAHFLGFRHDGPAILPHAQMGILVSDNEGLSNAVMEGMAASLPMVVTRVGGNPELVQDGVRGRVIPRRSPEALAEAMVELLREPEKARQMGKEARLFVERELTLEKLVNAHDALYQRLGGKAGRQPPRSAEAIEEAS